MDEDYNYGDRCGLDVPETRGERKKKKKVKCTEMSRRNLNLQAQLRSSNNLLKVQKCLIKA